MNINHADYMKKLQNWMYGQLSEQLEMDIITLSVEG